MDAPVLANQPSKTYIHKLYADTGFRLEYLPRGMANRDGWQKKIDRIFVVSTSFMMIIIICLDLTE